MAQLTSDEWPSDQEPTTEETQVELAERDVRGSKDEPPNSGGAVKTNQRGDDEAELLNVDFDSATD